MAANAPVMPPMPGSGRPSERIGVARVQHHGAAAAGAAVEGHAVGGHGGAVDLQGLAGRRGR